MCPEYDFKEIVLKRPKMQKHIKSAVKKIFQVYLGRIISLYQTQKKN